MKIGPVVHDNKLVLDGYNQEIFPETKAELYIFLRNCMIQEIPHIVQFQKEEYRDKYTAIGNRRVPTMKAVIIVNHTNTHRVIGED